MDDGIETRTRIVLAGVHADGRQLPEVEIDAEELGSFNWLYKCWGIDCILETGGNVKDSVRYAIQTTAEQAEHQAVYAVTGWKKTQDRWEYLMPGDSQRTVSLPVKMGGYRMERRWSDADLPVLKKLLRSSLAPSAVVLPLLAYTFLTPLNHFLKAAGIEPKFVLFLIGRTGSRKSTLAALFLSFFGRFTGSELPLSFRDTANSILYHTFTLKDVLTCIDDFHPAGRGEEGKLTATAQTIMRAYGDRTGRGRLRADATPLESRPPQGNAILTGEFPPDIGESGTARYFALELKENDVDLDELSQLQTATAEGQLNRCMFVYIEWLQRKFLCDEENEGRFLEALKVRFQQYRADFQAAKIGCHGRVPEAVAWLQLGMRLFLCFANDMGLLEEGACLNIQEQLRTILYHLAQQQADSVLQDKPTRKFVRGLYALLESDQVFVQGKTLGEFDLSQGCIGYEDENFFYLLSEVAYSAVRRMYIDQGEQFSISRNALIKQLAEEGMLEVSGNQNTKVLRFGGKNKRVLCLRKEAAQSVQDSVY